VSLPFRQSGASEVKPSSCMNCQGDGPFRLNTEKTVYRNYQKVLFYFIFVWLFLLLSLSQSLSQPPSFHPSPTRVAVSLKVPRPLVCPARSVR
jgi:hypothetical protein